MTIPKQSAIEIPLLTALRELGNEAKPADLYPRVAERFPEMTVDEQKIFLPSSPGTSKFNNRVQWVRQRLVEKGEIDGSSKGLWRITERGLERLRDPQSYETRHKSKPMEGVLVDILDNYQREWQRLPKTNNPYFRSIVADLKNCFSSLMAEFDLRIKPLGGQGAARKNPYISFPAPGHKTSKGVYPAFMFDLDRRVVRLFIGFSEDNLLSPDLMTDINQYVTKQMPQWLERSRFGSPCKEYRREDLLEGKVEEDFRELIRVYQSLLDEFEEPIESFLGEDEMVEVEANSISLEQTNKLIDRFLEWFENDPHRLSEFVPEYSALSQSFFASLSDGEYADFIFNFARNGGKIQNGGERTAGKLRQSILENPQIFRNLIAETFRPDFDLVQWWEEAKKFKGFGKGVRSILLHRLFPDRFNIYNEKSLEAYDMLGLLQKKGRGELLYQQIIEAGKKLVAIRPEQLTLFRADAFTHFLLGTEEGKAAWDEIVVETLATGEDELSGRIWLFVFPENRELLESFVTNNEVRLNYNLACDLTDMADQEEIRRQLVSINGLPKSIAPELWSFVQEIKQWDWVILKSGKEELCAIGVVRSSYIFDTANNWQHLRKVEWLKVGPWQLRENDSRLRKLPPEGLTDISGTPGVDYCLSVIGTDKGELSRLKAGVGASRQYTLEDAMDELFMSEEAFEELLEALVKKKNIVLQGPPGTGKTFVAKKLAYRLLQEQDKCRVQMVQFHQSYSYEDFVQGFRPCENGTFVRKDGVFYSFCEEARRKPEKPFVFIIDEVNRGNLSKIFGELMLLVEKDKRSSEYAVRLTYAREGEPNFYIPENVYLIGTMNTADRSLALVDYALRRRFRFLDLRPQLDSPKFCEYLKERCLEEKVANRMISCIQALNLFIREDKTDLGPGYEIGHSYFTPAVHERELGRKWYLQIVRHEVAPLLAEYWFDAPEKVERALGILEF